MCTLTFSSLKYSSQNYICPVQWKGEGKASSSPEYHHMKQDIGRGGKVPCILTSLLHESECIVTNSVRFSFLVKTPWFLIRDKVNCFPVSVGTQWQRENSLLLPRIECPSFSWKAVTLLTKRFRLKVPSIHTLKLVWIRVTSHAKLVSVFPHAGADVTLLF